MSDPKIAHKWPLKVNLEEGKKYFWCACGLSKNQPFCDGSHKDTDFKDFSVDSLILKSA